MKPSGNFLAGFILITGTLLNICTYRAKANFPSLLNSFK